MGDLVRDHMARGTDFGILAGEHMSAGRFVPDELVINFMRDQLRREDVLRTGIGSPTTAVSCYLCSHTALGHTQRLHLRTDALSCSLTHSKLCDRVIDLCCIH